MKRGLLGYHRFNESIDALNSEPVRYGAYDPAVVLDLGVELDALLTHGVAAFALADKIHFCQIDG